LQEGEVRAGDSVELLGRDPNHVSVTDVVRLYVAKKPDTELLRRVVELAALPANWRDNFLQRL
jgi:MOSC domain-containing protein YiiM